MIRAVLAALPRRFRWTLHNIVAHPLSEVLFQLGFEDAGNAIHDATIPPHVAGEGRG
jgi:ethanolamine utilization microcompartment shell protein EutS